MTSVILLRSLCDHRHGFHDAAYHRGRLSIDVRIPPETISFAQSRESIS